MRVEGRHKGKKALKKKSSVLKAVCCSLPDSLLVADRVKCFKPGGCPLSFLKILFSVSSAITHFSMYLRVIS